MATQTQAEVETLIDGIIIDNTTMQVNPAKVRAVLKAINARVPIGDPSAATFVQPLFYNPGTNQASISQASLITDGYIVKGDFKAIRVVPYGEMRIFEGPAHNLLGAALQIDDVAHFIYKVEETFTFFIGAYKGGDITDIEGSWGEILKSDYR